MVKIFSKLMLINLFLNNYSMSFENPILPENLKVLIKASCNKNFKEKTAECILAEILIEEFIKKNTRNLQARDKTGATVLIYAVKSAPDKIIDYLLKNRCDVNAQDYEGNTALMYAVLLNRPTVVELLSEYNANLRIKNNKGQTLYDMLPPETKVQKMNVVAK